MSSSGSRQAPAVSKKSWISTQPFDSALFLYGYGFNKTLMREAGYLYVNPAANSSNCPAGRIVYENGRKLNPSNGNFGGANDGVTTYMVGVFDAISGLSGFINPNGPFFSINNADKPVYLQDTSVDPTTGRPNLGTPVLTNGFILSVSGTGPNNGAGSMVGVVTGVSEGNFIAPRAYALAYNFDNNSEYPAIETSVPKNYGGFYDYVGMYGHDNSIYMGGLINPGDAKGTLTLSNGTATTGVNTLLYQNGTQSLVYLTRSTPVGALGHLWYTIGGTNSAPTLTVNSSSNNESSTINYFIVGTNYGGPP